MPDSFIPETIHETKELIREAKGIIPQTLAAVDNVASSTIQLIGSPALILNEYAKYGLEKTRRKLHAKLESIPKENLQPAPPYMFIPLAQNLLPYANCDYLHNMFINLLTSAMDKRKANSAHPAFVNIIKNLSPFDAKVLTSSIFTNQEFPVYKFRYQDKNAPICTIKGLNPIFKHVSTGYDIIPHLINISDKISPLHGDDVEACIENIVTQGLIELNNDSHYISAEPYDNDLALLKSLKMQFGRNPLYQTDKDFEMAIIPSKGRLTQMGQRFFESCVF